MLPTTVKLPILKLALRWACCPAAAPDKAKNPLGAMGTGLITGRWIVRVLPG